MPRYKGNAVSSGRPILHIIIEALDEALVDQLAYEHTQYEEGVVDGLAKAVALIIKPDDPDVAGVLEDAYARNDDNQSVTLPTPVESEPKAALNDFDWGT